MKYKFLLFLSIPFIIFYILCCLTIPFFIIYKKNKGVTFFIIKDKIHADFLFDSKLFQHLFKTKKKYTIVGWGDRKIFLETKHWKDLKLENFLKAFYGLNKTVLRVYHTNEIPKNKIIKKYKTSYFNLLEQHIKDSFVDKKIKKKKEYNQLGNFYESSLNYNCVTNCNNWINKGLKRCKTTYRVWAPLSMWL